MARLGVDAIDVYDAAQASARMSGQSLCIQSAAHGDGDDSALHLPRSNLLSTSRTCWLFVDRVAQYSVDPIRQAGKLS